MGGDDESLSDKNIRLFKLYSEKQDEGIIEEIATINNKFNYLIVKKFLNTGMDVDDLASIARIGMMKAIRTFEVDKGNRFSSYAGVCMSNEILQQIRKDRKAVKETSFETSLSNSTEGGEYTFENVIEDTGVDLLGNFIDEEELKELREVLKGLEGRDKMIIDLMYFQNKGQIEIGKILGISQPHVGRECKKILNSLRMKLESRGGY